MSSSQNDPFNKWLYFLTGLAVLVNFSGLFIPLMDPDASIYATISKNLVQSGNFVDLIHEEKDWLDKPHFQFWITAVSFKIFGIHDWSYKLPGILFVMLGAFYTYRFAKKYYDKHIALWSVVFLLSAQHIIISNIDIRAEAYLTGLIIAAIYHFASCIESKKNGHLIVAIFFSACAVMTKGLFTLIPIAGAVAGDLILKKKWRELFHIRWLLSLVLLVILIAPELFCLWRQFDSHPEKIIFEKTGVSGIRFFLWDSQFGRFFNSGPIKGKGDYFFFFHTLLWAFLPWALIMYLSLVNKLRGIKKQINITNQEWFTLFGSLSALILFSLSKFQLPYYTNIIFPLLAILTARYICQLKKHTSIRLLKIILYSICAIILAAGTLLHILYKPSANPIALIVLIACAILLFGLLPSFVKMTGINKVLFQTGIVSIIFNLYMTSFFYPDLLKYQGSSEAAFYMNENFSGQQVICRNTYDASFEFYLKASILHIGKNSTNLDYPGIWYVLPWELEELNTKKVSYQVLKEIPTFRITMLSLKFINKKTRDTELNKLYLIRVISNNKTND